VRFAGFDEAAGFAEGAMQPVSVTVGASHAVVGQVLPAQALHGNAGGGADRQEVAVLAAGAGAWSADCKVSRRLTCRSRLT
jgi:hypothetical protein